MAITGSATIFRSHSGLWCRLPRRRGSVSDVAFISASSQYLAALLLEYFPRAIPRELRVILEAEAHP